MKMLNALAAAGLLLSTGAVATAAQAQDYNGHHNQYDRDHRGDYDRDHRGDRDDRDRDHRRDWDRHDNGHHYGWDRGRHNGWDNHRRCWTEWRHHHQVRVCR